MQVSDVLDGDWDALEPLRNPVLVVALRGWFDVAGVATGALEWAIQDRAVTVVASIDPDPFLTSPKSAQRLLSTKMATARFAGPKTSFW